MLILEIEAAIAPLQNRIAELEAALAGKTPVNAVPGKLSGA